MLINRLLIDLAHGDCPRLIVTLPPRHGKSMLLSQYFPAWYLGRYQDRRVMLASYEAGFAATWGRKARDVLEEYGQQLFDVKIRDDSSAADRWDIKGHPGGMVTAGVGGPLTGKGADVLMIDDPVKNAEEAASQTIRERVWEWYQSTAYTRLEPNGAIVVIMTRWHRDDLAGRLIRESETGGERWKVVNLPAIAEPNDPLGRAPGTPLWPERYDLMRLDEIRKTLSSYYWQALYQQSPIPPGGEMIKRSWFPIVTNPPASMRVCRYWDKAASEGKGDYTVGVKMGEAQGRCVILNIVRGRLSSGDVELTIKRTAEADGAGVTVFMEEEGGSSGKDVTDHYQRHVLRGSSFYAIRPTGSKIIRASPFAAAAEQGRITLFNDGAAAWIGPFLDEVEVFPKGEHDDQVDAAAGAYNQLMKSGGGAYIDPSDAAIGRNNIPSFGGGRRIDEDDEYEIPGL